ncbi:MAG: hypothetical protein EZS28_034787, partial [Streblomastix strix]
MKTGFKETNVHRLAKFHKLSSKLTCMQSYIKQKNTELIVLLSRSEDVGIRGAKTYVYRHQRELKETTTLCFPVDSILAIDEMA